MLWVVVTDIDSQSYPSYLQLEKHDQQHKLYNRNRSPQTQQPLHQNPEQHQRQR